MRIDRTLSQADPKHDSTPGLWSELSDMVACLRRDLFTSYRPERHYMRGPGPACRAKQALAAAPVAALNPRLSPQAIRPARRPWRDIELAPKFLWA